MNSDDNHNEGSAHKEQDDLNVALASTSEQKAVSEGAHSGTSEAGNENRDDKTVRVTRNSTIRNLVSYVMMRVKAGDTMTVQGLGLGISKAITVVSIVRDRLGSVH